MFNTLIDTKVFSEFITALKDVSSGAKILFSNEGLSTTAVDAAQVAMVQVKTSPLGSFNGDPVELILDIPRLSLLTSGENIHLSYDGNVLRGNTGRTKYNIPILVDAAVKAMPMPNLHHALVVRVDPGEFYTGVKAISGVYSEKDSATYIKIFFKDNELILTDASGYECVVTFEESEIDILIDPGSEVTTKIAMEYMLKYANRIKNAEGLTLHMGIDYPLKLVGESPNVNVTYLIAPRVDVE